MSSKQWSEEAVKTWLEAQQRYWSTLTSVTPHFTNTTVNPSPANPAQTPTWASDLNQWWSTVTHDSPPQIQDVLNRVMEMGKVYLGLAEQVYSNSKADPDTPNLETWMRSLEHGFNQWLQGGQAASNLGLGQSVFEGWQQLVGNMQGMNLFREVGAGGLTLPNAGLWQEHLQKALATPSFGVSRAGQERLKKLAALALRYQQSMDKYNEAFATQGQASVQALRSRIQKLADQGRNINSLRELYDLWVDVSEETYAQFAASEQYQILYGELVNTFLLLKQGMNEHLEAEFKAFGLPARADYEAVIKKQYELKRENQRLRQQLRELDQRLKRVEQTLQMTAIQEAAQ